MMTNRQIANSFRMLGDLLELHDENPFKVRSYRTAYQNIRGLARPLSTMSTEERGAIPGIGKAIGAKIEELITTGTMQVLEDVKQKTPLGIQDILSIKGLGPKKIKALWHGLEIDSAGELLYACQENRLVKLKGFGAKSQAAIESKVSYFLESKGLHLYRQVDMIYDKLEGALAKLKVIKASIVGDLALRRNVITSIDYLYQGDILSPEVLEEAGFEIRNDRVDAHDIVTYFLDHYQVRFIRVEQDFNRAWIERCCSEAFWQFILSKGITIDDKVPRQAIEKRLGIDRIPVPSRELIPSEKMDVEKLIKPSDIKGMIHCHSTYSDGSDTLKQMAITCKELGYAYMVITDHSQAAFYANGLKEDDLWRQWQEIEALNALWDDFRIIKGIEVDILNDGRLDYTDDILSHFEIVIASIHSNLNMEEKKATARLIKAIENPYTHILGHMTGRLLLARQGYPVDHQKIIEACAANHVTIELNANPYRLDIDWNWLPVAQQAGVKISINPDAHQIGDLDFIKYGIVSARKGLLMKDNCINTLTAEGLLNYIKKY